jgi:arginyl-tRNA synthetase
VSSLKKAMASAYPEAGLSDDELMLSITVPQGQEWDLSSSIAFRLAKKLGANPAEIAGKLSGLMPAGNYVASVEATNGYLNARLDERKYTSLVLARIRDEGGAYGTSAMGEGRKVIVESPSANPAHPWHVGTLRNALLGNVVSNLFEACSYEAEREDYIDDLGLQVATALWGWINMGDKPDKKFDQWLGELYVRVNREMGQRPEVKKQVEALNKEMEDGVSQQARAGREMAERCVMAHQQTAFDYGIYRDVMIWESDIVRSHLLSKALDISSGILEKPSDGKYAGAVVIKLDRITPFAGELAGSREDAKVIVRSNGTATYIGKDFAFHAWKFGLIDAGFKYRKFMDQPNGKPIYSTAPEGSPMQFGNVERAINVIGGEQAYEQQIMRVMFSLIGHEEITRGLFHLAYGRVNIEGEKLSARSGNWLGDGRNYTADDLLAEATKRAMEIAQKSEKITDRQNLEHISRAVALSAIKFEYLKIATEKDITFSWQNALNFEGNSGPYVLYTYARAMRILGKSASAAAMSDSDVSQITRGQDFQLVKLMGMAQDTVEKACTELRPSVVTDYLLGLSSLFSKFYETMPVVKGGDAKNVRLEVVRSFTAVASNMLSLLGIATVSEM